MAGDLFKSNRLHIPERNKVVIIGAGPVGLVASLLLNQYRVPHVLVEQLPKPDKHSQAHFLNCRSMEILRELDMLNQAVYTLSAPVEEWRRFVYCTGLANLPTVDHVQPASTDSVLGVVDHFADGQHLEMSPERVTHFPQHDFVRLLRSAALKSNVCHAVEGHRASIQEYPDRVAVMLTNSRTGRRQQIEWLKFNSPIARRRRRAVHKIFSDAKRQTLQLLFPGQDLGFTYTAGWLFGQNRNETASLDPFVFRPQLIVGGRMPHFWLVDHRGRRISTLDLPRRMMKAESLPCYVLLKAGNLKTDFHEFSGLKKQSIANVSVSGNQGHDKYHFSYDSDRPAFLPKAYAILIRPDGHIAWFKAKASNNHRPANDFRAASER
jgi:hypothetical protein